MFSLFYSIRMPISVTNADKSIWSIEVRNCAVTGTRLIADCPGRVRLAPLTQREQQYFHLRSLDNRMRHPDLISLFDLLDRWRHLPSYRLEPRADAFFALFLVDVLDRHLQSRGVRVDPRVIPEFPLGQRGTKRSDKADYFAVSADRKHAFLIELKTDMRSLKVDQGQLPESCQGPWSRRAAL